MKGHRYQTRSKSNRHNERNEIGCSSRTATNQPLPRTDELDSYAHPKRTYYRAQQTRFLDLPQEIILLILITLPVKTLSILKCVNRYFSCSISCPDFIEKHLKFASEDASMSGYRVIVCSDGLSIAELNQLSTPRIMWRESSLVDIIDIDILKKESIRVELFGSCNGLVFVTFNPNHLFIWNPTTRKHKKLPDIVKLESLNNVFCAQFCFGFGYDVSNDDYKVVLLAAQNNCLGSWSGKDYAVYVYSLKRAFWMRIPDFTEPFGKAVGWYGTFASGQLHWNTFSLDIVSFDVEKEVFGTLEQPNYAEGCLNMELSVLGESICVSYYYMKSVYVWAMKEYGKKESWNKIITLPHYDHVITYSYPCSYLPNGEILIKANNLEIYNPVHKLSYLVDGCPSFQF